MEDVTDIEIGGYRFTDPALLENALTHSSYLHEHPEENAPDFERLEFLGDAVVDLVVGEELYRRFPDATEGELTALRAGLAASLYESVVGACYIESGLAAATALVQRTMGDAIAETVSSPRKSPKTLLQEWAQAAHHPLPLYRTLDVSGPEHKRGFVVEVEVAGNVAQGTGPSKRAAEEAAAAKLMELVTQ